MSAAASSAVPPGVADEAQPHSLEARGVSRSFSEGARRVDVLRNVNLEVRHGEAVAMLGASGAGKSTLLHLLGGLDTPSEGEVWVRGQHMSALGEARRGRLRNVALGFVYQFHHLLAEFTALENIALPMLVGGDSPAEARGRAAELLERVGLAARAEHRPGQLSGGERQRVAVARALVRSPACVLADEPTGNLDRRNATAILDLLLELNAESGTSLLIATHDESLAARLHRRLRVVDGRVEDA